MAAGHQMVYGKSYQKWEREILVILQFLFGVAVGMDLLNHTRLMFLLFHAIVAQ